MKSPRTPTRSFRKRGISFFRRGNAEDRSIFVMTLGLTGRLFCGNGGFFWQHHGNVIAYRVHPEASFAFQPGVIGKQMYWFDANGTTQNLEKFLGNRHTRSVIQSDTNNPAAWPARPPPQHTYG